MMKLFLHKIVSQQENYIQISRKFSNSKVNKTIELFHDTNIYLY